MGVKSSVQLSYQGKVQVLPVVYQIELVEFYWYTNANAAMWLAELLVYYQPLEYSGCRPSTKCDVFIVFRRLFWKEF